MEPLFAALSAVLAAVPEPALRETLRLWRVVHVREHVMVWREGRPADAVVVVHSGALELSIDGTVVGEVQASETIGEDALYAADARRFASMRARTRTRLLVLSLADIAILRARSSPVHDALLLQAIAGAAERGRTLDRLLAQIHTVGSGPPVPGASGLFRRLWRRVAGTPSSPPDCPPAAPLLAQHPLLARAGSQVRAAIAAACIPVAFSAGQALLRQGDSDSRVLVLAAGECDVLRTIEAPGGAQLLGRVEPGAIVGVDAFAGGTRAASVVATTAGWALVMTRDACERMPPRARTAWLELVLALSVRRHEAAARALQRAIGVFASSQEEALPSPPLAAESGDPWTYR